MSRLQSVSASPMLQQFAQGAAQSALMPVANFIAPTVDVSTSVGRYKVYTAKNRFHIPETLRAIGGRAAELRFDASDATYNCEPHALDYPVDNLEKLEEAQIKDTLEEAATAISQVAALAHEKTVLDAAVAAVGNGTNKVWNASADPVADIDAAILADIETCKFGSLMNVGVLFGASAWNLFKTAPAVRSRFIVGGSNKGGLGLAVATESIASQLFIGNPDVRTSYMVFDAAAEGLPESISFLLDTAVLIFARLIAPTRLDPSFMKTFRLMGQYMVPGSYVRDDGRVEVAKFDWSEDVKVTNSAGCLRLNVSAS